MDDKFRVIASRLIVFSQKAITTMAILGNKNLVTKEELEIIQKALNTIKEVDRRYMEDIKE